MKRILAMLCAISIVILSLYPTTFAYATNQSKSKATDTPTNKSNPVSNDTSNTKEDTYWPNAFDDSKLTAQSAILMDADTGLILYEKNAYDSHYPASITKIMTTLLAIENASLGEVVTFSKSAAFGIEAGSSTIYTDVGEKLTVEQCLYAMMLESANEVCLGIAEHVSGNVESFADLMNSRAKEIGCKNTHFSNPHGLHSDDHYTCAYDMALIGREALKSSTFRTVASAKRYVMPATNKKPERYWNNHHQMVYGWKYPQYESSSCIGGKTGFTQMAGNTLVTFAEKNGMTLIAVVMCAASHANQKQNQYTDTKRLLDYGFDNFTIYNMSDLGVNDSSTDSPLFTKYNDIFNEEYSPIHVSENGKILLPNGVDISEAERNITYQPRTKTESGDTVMGTITYIYNNKEVGFSNILCRNDTGPTLVLGKAIEKIQTNKMKDANTPKDLKPIIVWILLSIFIIALVLFYFIAIRPKRTSFFYYSKKKYRDSDHMDF